MKTTTKHFELEDGICTILPGVRNITKNIDPLLEECNRQNNVSAKAAVLDYADRNLKPVDPVKDLELKDL